MQMKAVPKEIGLPEDQISDMIDTGWVCIPGVSIAVPGQAIAVPGQDRVGPPVRIVDLWISPRTNMIPVPAMVTAIYELGKKEGASGVEVLDLMARNFFSMSLADLMQRVEANAQSVVVEEEEIDGSE